MPEKKSDTRLLVWDKNTRAFHWLLVLVFTGSIGTGLYGDFSVMDWHMRLGYLMLGLLIFRVLSGLVAGDYGRFSRFPLSPRAVIAYLRNGREYPGHNPLGSWMVVVMLLVLTLQTLAGLMTSDAIFLEGPWVAAVPAEWSDLASTFHSNAWRLLLLLVALHLSAIAYYQLVRRINLLWPMVSGYKQASASLVDATPATPMPWPTFLGLIATAGVLSWLAITWP